MATQHDDILNYLQEYGKLTPWKAFEHLGITKLATRVSELKRAGYDIQGKMIKVKARNGRETQVMEYWWDDPRKDTASWLEHEMDRVDAILTNTTSRPLWNDLTKYRAKLEKRMKAVTGKWK